jgi:hypothetical protein
MSQPTHDTYDVIVGDLADRFNPSAGIEPTNVFTGPLAEAEEQYAQYVSAARTGRYEWVKLRHGGPSGDVVRSWPESRKQ